MPQATALVVGSIIGASIFVQPSEITGQVNSITGVLLVWLVSGILSFFGALVCAELASIFTRSGGIYVYLKEAFSPSIGFLWGWTMFWSVHSGIIAAIAVIFSRYFSYFLPMNDFLINAVAIAAIAFLSAINYLGVKQGSTFQTLFTLGKILAILFIIVVGFVLGSRISDHFTLGDIAQNDISLGPFFLALIAGLFAFGGWQMVTYNAEETKNPQKNIPRALMIGMLIVTICYIALNAVYMYILPLDKVASSTRIAADAANALIGYGGGAFMSGLVMFSTVGALSGIILSGPRAYFAMAQDGLIFKWMGKIHPRYRTPHRAIVIQAVWASVLVTTGSYRVLFTRVVFAAWIFYGLMAIGLFLLRRRPEIKREYRIWGYPLVPAIFVLAAFSLVVNQIISDPAESLIGLTFILIGLPAYHFWFRKIRNEDQK
ncbi:MAG: amino acid permease [Candidatus Aminicenantes bacterium]|nr:MAG: amino acid permease [Candidatus Aminicenantes bacterium]